MTGTKPIPASDDLASDIDPLIEALAAAERSDRELRAQVNHATHARARASAETSRLRQLGERTEDAALIELAERYQRQATVLDQELQSLRGMVETQRVVIERLRATIVGA